MKLTAKLLLAIALVFGASAVLNAWILNATVAPGFAALERDQALEDAGRIVEALRREGEHLGLITQDYAFWNDTYDYALKRNEDYEIDNLFPETLIDLSVNALQLLDRDGNVLWRLILDIDSGEEIVIPELPEDRFPADHPILVHRPDDDSFHGLLKTRAGIMLVAAAPILFNDSRGPPAGTFLFGRLLTAEMISGLKARTAVDFELLVLPDDSLTEADDRALAQITEASPIAIEETSDDLLTVRTLLYDLDGKPIGLVRAKIARDITRIGYETEIAALALLLLAGFFTVLTIAIFVRMNIIAPLRRLTGRIASIRESGRLPDVEEAESGVRADELGILSREFDAMTRQLKTTRERLMEQSYFAGRAESVAGVMHNVRNALNPVNLTLWHVIKTLKDRRTEHLQTAVAELQDDAVPADRRAKLWTFLGQSFQKLDDERQQLLVDLDDIAKQHRLVDEILVEHEDSSHFDRLVEEIDLPSLLAETAQIVPREGEPRVTVILPASAPSVAANRILLSQVLANLFMNAHEAIAATGRDHGKITVTCAEDDSPEKAMVRLTVADDGDGIASDRLVQIFERGHSSRTHKKGGFGLHWCANTLTGMGGRISVSSDGPGKGATFHVFLPAAKGSVEEAAQ